MELKLSQLTTTSTANINGLVAQLKAQEESMKQERERVKFDSETWRTQMTELEHELDGAGNKWRSQLAAARDETERQRRAAYEMQIAPRSAASDFTHVAVNSARVAA